MQTQIVASVRAPSAIAPRPCRVSNKAAVRVPKRCLAVVRAATEEEVVSTNGSSNGKVATSPEPLDFDELSDLIKMVHETDIVELELKHSRFTLAVRKREALQAAEAPQVQYVQMAPAAAPAAAPAPAAAAPPPPPPPAAAPAAPVAARPAAPAKIEGVEIVAPMAGTVYRSPAPGEPFFVKEGDVVKKGQTVCIIEAMKLMNEIEAEVGGTVVKVMVDHSKPVAAGQALLIVKP